MNIILSFSEVWRSETNAILQLYEPGINQTQSNILLFYNIVQLWSQLIIQFKNKLFLVLSLLFSLFLSSIFPFSNILYFQCTAIFPFNNSLINFYLPIFYLVCKKYLISFYLYLLFQHYSCLYFYINICLFLARIKQFIMTMIAENQGMEMECIICLSIQENLPFCMVDCPAGHIYHLKCLENWVRKGNKNCPHDRKEIQLVLCQGRISKISRCLNHDQRCFLCNQEYKPQQVKLKCLVCKILPCHAKCLKDISVDNIPDFNKYQTCQYCQYQLRQWSVMREVFLSNLKILLENKFYECERQIKELEKRKKQLQLKQQQILKSIEDLGNPR